MSYGSEKIKKIILEEYYQLMQEIEIKSFTDQFQAEIPGETSNPSEFEREMQAGIKQAISKLRDRVDISGEERLQQYYKQASTAIDNLLDKKDYKTALKLLKRVKKEVDEYAPEGEMVSLDLISNFFARANDFLKKAEELLERLKSGSTELSETKQQERHDAFVLSLSRNTDILRTLVESLDNIYAMAIKGSKGVGGGISVTYVNNSWHILSFKQAYEKAIIPEFQKLYKNENFLDDKYKRKIDSLIEQMKNPNNFTQAIEGYANAVAKIIERFNDSPEIFKKPLETDNIAKDEKIEKRIEKAFKEYDKLELDTITENTEPEYLEKLKEYTKFLASKISEFREKPTLQRKDFWELRKQAVPDKALESLVKRLGDWETLLRLFEESVKLTKAQLSLKVKDTTTGKDKAYEKEMTFYKENIGKIIRILHDIYANNIVPPDHLKTYLAQLSLIKESESEKEYYILDVTLLEQVKKQLERIKSLDDKIRKNNLDFEQFADMLYPPEERPVYSNLKDMFIAIKQKFKAEYVNPLKAFIKRAKKTPKKTLRQHNLDTLVDIIGEFNTADSLEEWYRTNWENKWSVSENDAKDVIIPAIISKMEELYPKGSYKLIMNLKKHFREKKKKITPLLRKIIQQLQKTTVAKIQDAKMRKHAEAWERFFSAKEKKSSNTKQESIHRLLLPLIKSELKRVKHG